MKRIHKFAALSGLSLMLAFAVAPAALATGAASARAPARSASLPNTNIKGKPAHFSPSKLSAKARWNGVSTCAASNASFTATNKKGVSETITFTGAASGSVTVPAHQRFFICVVTGRTGKLVGKLNDGKKLTVHLK